jgi:hypothetical protein
MSKRDIRWDALKHVEVDVHLGGAMVFIHPQSPGHFGQRRQQAPVNSDQAAQGLRVLTASSGENLLGQFRNELAKQIGVKNPGGLTQRAQTCPRAAEVVLDLPKLAGLLDAAQTIDDGIEVEQEDQRAVLVKMKDAIAGDITLGCAFMKPFEERVD